MEILEVDPGVRDLILRQANADQIRDSAVAGGMVTLRDGGLHRVRQGITTIEEILRVTST
jgi:type IV pilus assembly protein PilB